MFDYQNEKDKYVKLLHERYGSLNLTRKQAAEALNISTATLDRWRSRGFGPRYTKMESDSASKNGRVLYPVIAVADYIVNNQMKTL